MDGSRTPDHHNTSPRPQPVLPVEQQGSIACDLLPPPAAFPEEPVSSTSVLGYCKTNTILAVARGSSKEAWGFCSPAYNKIAAENTESAVWSTLRLAININEGCHKWQGSRIASAET